MKRMIFTLPAVLFFCTAFAQELPPLNNIRMETREDYHSYNAFALRVSLYLLANPIDKNDEDRLKASVFLFRWIEGTPDFNFSSMTNGLKFVKKDVDLVGVYYASLTAYAIQNNSTDSNTITINGARKLVAYINNPNNHVVLTNRLKRLSQADEKGDLKSFLKL